MSVKVQFTRNGRDTGDAITRRPENSNDIHFKFTPGTKPPKLWYTQDGDKLAGDQEHTAPEDALDVGIEFSVDANGKLTMRDSHWTNGKGEAIGGADGYIPPPKGANDWHLDVQDGKITDAYWSRNGESYVPRQSLDVPKDANDAHVSQEPSAHRGNLQDVHGERAALAAVIGYVLGASVDGRDAGQPMAVLRGLGLWRDQFGGGFPGLLRQDSPEVKEDPCGKLLEKSDELNTMMDGVKIRYIIERFERCIHITYLGSGSGGKGNTVLELPPGPEQTVGPNKKKVRVYYKGFRAETVAIDKQGTLDWSGGCYVFVVDCEKYRFVQYKRRSSKWSTDAAAKTGGWEIDGGGKDNSKPFGGTVPKPKDGSGDKSGASYDFPGSAETEPEKDVPDETKLVVSDEFQTFVCCDGQSLGYWEWSVTRTFRYRGKIALSPPAVDASKPEWHAPGDSKNAVNCA